MVDDEITNEKLKGLSKEEVAEIEENFKEFDAEGKGGLSKGQLKACLYSLGEERNKAEIDRIMNERGGGGGQIPKEQFKAFMIELMGVSDTKEDVLNSWEVINRGPKEVADVERMEIVMSKHDVDYFKDTAKQVGGGYNHKDWTDDVFAR